MDLIVFIKACRISPPSVVLISLLISLKSMSSRVFLATSGFSSSTLPKPAATFVGAFIKLVYVFKRLARDLLIALSQGDEHLLCSFFLGLNIHAQNLDSKVIIQGE